MKRVATLILNRNLPLLVEEVYDNLKKNNHQLNDIYVIEAGTDKDKLSKKTSWHANWDDAMKNGLRFNRGMNFGLSKLIEEGRFKTYEYFFLITNDTVLDNKPIIQDLCEVMDNHPRLGILSPCSRFWGELKLLKENHTMYFWFIHNNAYMLRRDFIEAIYDLEGDQTKTLLFDGTNFRGYGTELELIAKAYANDWAAGITSKVLCSENESYLINNSELIKTEAYEENLKLYLEEGKKWMKRKYGFSSRWAMQQYTKCFYDHFFEFHPEFKQFQI